MYLILSKLTSKLNGRANLILKKSCISLLGLNYKKKIKKYGAKICPPKENPSSAHLVARVVMRLSLKQMSFVTHSNLLSYCSVLYPFQASFGYVFHFALCRYRSLFLLFQLQKWGLGKRARYAVGNLQIRALWQ